MLKNFTLTPFACCKTYFCSNSKKLPRTKGKVGARFNRDPRAFKNHTPGIPFLFCCRNVLILELLNVSATATNGCKEDILPFVWCGYRKRPTATDTAEDT